MTVYARPSKRGPVFFYDFWLDRRRHVGRIGLVSRRRAEQAETLVRARLLDKRIQAMFGLPSSSAVAPPLDAFCEHTLLPQLKNNLAGKGYATAASALKRIRRSLGHHRLDRITASELEAFKAERLAEVSVNMVHADFQWIRRIFAEAIRAGHVHKNPTQGFKLPRRTPAPDRVLTEEEETRLFAKGLKDETLRRIVAVDLVTGWRREAICSVTGARVDLTELRATIRMKGGRDVTLPITEEAATVLRPLVDAHPEGAIFRNRLGHCVNPQSVAESFRRALRRAGIKRCRFHDLRHTFATRLAQRRWDVATVGALLGHTPPYRETQRYFAHTSEDRMREALESL